MAELGPRERVLLLALAVALLVIAGLATIAASTVGGSDHPDQRIPVELVEPKPGDNVVWPYTSRERAVDGRTLAINVVVHGDADALRFYLTERPGATWNETDEELRDAEHDELDGISEERANATVVDWASAEGSTRYLYVHEYAFTEEGPNGTTRRPYYALPFTREESGEVDGRWIDESYQIHDGTYFGTRYHLRVYESPHESDDWIAIQAHSDHWDWFRLRHTVDGTENAQDRVESEFMGRPFVDDVWRMYLHNNEGSDADGWATVVALEGSSPAAPDDGSGTTAVASDETRLSPAVLLGFALGIAFVGAGRTSLVRTADRIARLRGQVDGDHTREGRSGDSTREGRSGDSTREGRSGDSTREGRSGDSTREAALRDAADDVDSLGAALVRRLEHRQLVVLLRAVTYGQLFASLIVLYLSVRAGGIFLETQFPQLSPKTIAASLYPLIAVGIPAVAYVFGRALDPVRGFALAAVGIETAIVVDYLYLDIALLPIDVVLHRLGVAIAIGLIAAGATHRRTEVPTVNRWFAAGVLFWVFLLLAPLVGWI